MSGEGGRRGPSVPPPGCATDTVDKHVLDAKYPQSNMRHSSFFFLFRTASAQKNHIMSVKIRPLKNMLALMHAF